LKFEIVESNPGTIEERKEIILLIAARMVSLSLTVQSSQQNPKAINQQRIKRK